MTRQEVLSDFGRGMAPAFVETPPRLGFTRAEQQMLRQAIFGYTDVELAERLQLALPTIKNRWRALYDRLGQIAPELVAEINVSSNPAVRGQEKRRRLLDYVRRHPEELPPINAGAASSVSSSSWRSSAHTSFSEFPPSNEMPEAPQLRRS